MQLSLLIEKFIESYGVFSIFIIIVLEYASIPLPSEIVLPLVGILTLKYEMNLVLVIIVSIIAGLIGSLINYYLGYKFGEKFIPFIERKYPKTKSAINSSYIWIDKYGKSSVMLSRLLPIARTFISIIAGATKMNIVAFLVYSTLGIGIWNVSLITIGYFIGDNMSVIGNIIKDYSVVMMIIVIIGIIVFMISKKRKFIFKNKDL